MTHTYTVSGMTCEGCVAKVKHQLLLHPDITTAEVTLPEKAVITMGRHLTVTQLQDAIGRDSKYRILEDYGSAHSDQQPEPAHASTSWFATYKPVLLIFAFIAAVSLVTSTHNGEVHGMMLMNTFMGGFFLVFSFFKLLNLEGFADSYAMYDIVARRVPAWGYVYAFIELALGFAYLTGFNPFVTNTVTFVVMSVSLIGVLQSLLNRKRIQCACLGAVFNLPMSTVTVVEDGLMIVMSGVMLVLMSSF